MSPISRLLYEFSNFRVNMAERLLTRDGERIAVPEKVFETLCALIKNAGRLVEKDELIAEVWGETIVEENNLDKKVSALRKILGERAGGEKFIETVRGHGYRFVAEVHLVEVENKPSEKTAFKDSQGELPKDSDNHHYTVERRGNVLAVADWQRERNADENENKITAPSQIAVQSAADNFTDLTDKREAEIHQKPLAVEMNLQLPLLKNERTVVAVLPFKLINPASSEEYLGVGLADALIVNLSKVTDLQVRPLASVSRYAAPDANAFAAGRALNAAFVLDGIIHKADETLLVTFQLIGTADESLIWAERFEGSMSDIFRLADRISTKIAETLAPQVSSRERRKLAERDTQNPKACEAYLRGRYFWNQFVPESFAKALESFQLAVALDPDYARGYAAIAEFYNSAGVFGVLPLAECIEQTKAAARRALEIDESLSEAYTALGFVTATYEWNLAEGERLYRKALELNPNDSLAHEWLANLLLITGRTAEWRAEISCAESINPLSALTKALAAWQLYQARLFTEADAKARELIEFDKYFSPGYEQLGNILEQLGQAAEAVAVLRHSLQLTPNSGIALYQLCFAYIADGQPEKAREVLEKMKARYSETGMNSYFLAMAHAAVGETDAAFELFNRAFVERDPWMFWFGTEPKLDGLRADPKFADLIQRMNFPLTEAVSGRTTTTQQPIAETAPPAKEAAGGAAMYVKKKSNIRPVALLAVISVVTLAGIVFAFYKFASPAPMRFEARKITRLTSSGRVKAVAISPDGKFVIYSQEESDGRQSLRVKHIGSDSDVEIAAPVETVYHGLNISPDGNQLYFVTEKGILFRKPVLGGAAKKIADRLYVRNILTNVGISPDSKQIAFVRRFENDATALFIVNADGTNERQLAAFEQPTRLNPYVVWAPDGKVLACSSAHPDYGLNVLAVQASDGTAAPIIQPEFQVLILQTAWMPDSKSLLAVGNDGGGYAYHLWRLLQFSTAGGAPRQITDNTTSYSGISLTSEGRFAATVKQEQVAHIWTMQIEDSTPARQLTTGFEKMDGKDGLDWMPDGRIVYDSSPSGKSSIWAVKTDGGNPTQIIKDGFRSAASPDGRSLVFTKGDGLWQMNTSDGSEIQMTSDSDNWQTFSPDGKWIVFTRFGERLGLWKMPGEGGEAKPILIENAICPTISPDGKIIAFVWRKAGQTNRIALVSSDGGEIIKSFDAGLQNNPSGDNQKLQWTADGSGVYFIALNGGVSNIWKQPIDGSAPVQVTDFKDGRIFNFAFSPDGSQIALSRGTFNSDVVLIENQVGGSYEHYPTAEPSAASPVKQIQPTVPQTTTTKLYTQMTESEKAAFIREQTRRVEDLIEAAPTELNDEEIQAIKAEIDGYVEDIESVSQKPFEEGFRVIFGRASQFAPLVRRSFEKRGVPPVLGVYQAMVESEYHDCITSAAGTVGLFQFRRETATRYGLMPKDYCNVEKQSDAAAWYMSDSISDFDGEKTLALLAFNFGHNGVRDYLRQLRERNVAERNAWVIRRHGSDLKPPLTEDQESYRYVPRFYAAAIIGENLPTFDFYAPPLSTLR